MIISRIRSTLSVRSISLVLLVLLVELCCLPTNTAVPVAGLQIQPRSSDNRELCKHHSSSKGVSCNFHDTCIESTLQCGTDGFALSYAYPRCNAIRLFRASNDSCKYCLSSQKLVDWALETENCVQPRLRDLAERFYKDIPYKNVPDPLDCIRFENEAFDTYKKCYAESSNVFCSLFHDNFEADLAKIAAAITIGDYYESVVHEQLRAMLKECDANELAQKLAPEPPSRTTICVTVTEGDASIDKQIEVVAATLKKNSNDFVIADIHVVDEVVSTEVSEACRDVAKFLGSLDDYRLIQFVSSAGSPQLDTNEYTVTVDSSTRMAFFVYRSNHDIPSCGNGQREAGEECDAFGINGIRGSGCDTSCSIDELYTCTVQALDTSKCTMTHCGDGLKTANEQCDDGNLVPNDGCSNYCTLEDGFRCESSFNRTSTCTLLTNQHISTPTLQLVATSPLPTQITPSAKTIIQVPTSSASSLRLTRVWTLFLPLLLTLFLSRVIVVR